MKNELKNHKKSDRIKWGITGVAFVLVFVFCVGLCMQLFGPDKVKPSEWFKKSNTEPTTPIDGDEELKESSSITETYILYV